MAKQTASITTWLAVGLAAYTSLAAGQRTALAASHDLAGVLPKESLVYLGWSGSDAMSDASARTAMGKILAESQVKRMCDEVWTKIDAYLKQEAAHDPEAELVYGPIKQLLGLLWHRPACLALMDLGVGEQGPSVQLALVVHLAKDEDKQAVVKAVELVMESAELPQPEPSEVAGAQLKSVQLPIPVPAVVYGFVDNYFMAALGNVTAEKVVAAIRGQAPRLIENEEFAAARKKLGGDISTMGCNLYVDVGECIGRVMAFVAAMSGEEPPAQIQATIEASGLSKVRSLSAATHLRDGGYRTTIHLHAPAPRTGLLKAFDQAEITEADLLILPKDASWFWALNLDLAGLFREIVDMVGKIDSEIHESLTEGLSTMAEETGVKLEQDLLEPLGETWVLFDAPSNGGVWFTGITLVVEARDAAQFDRSLRKLLEHLNKELAGGSLEVATTSLGPHTVRFVNVVGVPIPIAPAWGIDKKHVVIALYPQMVATTLDRLAAASKEDSILANADFQRGRKLLPGKLYALSYVDSRRAFESIYPFLVPFAQMAAAMAQEEISGLNISLLPQRDVISRHLFGDVSGTMSDEDGVTSVSHGPLPVVLGSGGTAMTLPLVTAIALPALHSARMAAKRTVSAANLRRIGQACKVYANQNEEKWPPDFKTLVDNGTISEHTLRSPFDKLGNVSYVYIAGQTENDDPRNVVVYEKPELHKNKGTNVLFLDGHVEWMPMPAFKEAVAETYRRLDKEIPELLK